MVRCDDFYRKWQESGNFCEKNPCTAERIEVYLDMLPVVVNKASESEILSSNSETMGSIITERASRPLISLKNPEIRQKAIQQIVKIAEQKKIDGKKPLVTTKEVEEIIQVLSPEAAEKESKKASKVSRTSKLDTAKEKLKAELGNVAYTPEAINSAIIKIDEISEFLQTTKQSLIQRKETLAQCGDASTCPACCGAGANENSDVPTSVTSDEQQSCSPCGA